MLASDLSLFFHLLLLSRLSIDVLVAICNLVNVRLVHHRRTVWIEHLLWVAGSLCHLVV